MLSRDLPTETVGAPDRGGEEAGSVAETDPDALHRELRRRERERRELVQQYERLLDERDERIDELRDSESERTLRGRISGLFDGGL